jgi:hypothetical protein
VCWRAPTKPTSPASSLKRRGSKTASMTVGSSQGHLVFGHGIAQQEENE